MALIKKSVPLLVSFQFLNTPVNNLPMSNGELQRGSAHNTRSSAYKLEVEWPNTERLKNRPTAGHITSAYCQQAEDPLQLTLEGLQELQSLHCNWTWLKLQNNKLETQKIEKKERNKSSNISGYTYSLQPTQPQLLTKAKGS